MEDHRLGSILLEGGIVAEADLERCLAIQTLTGGSLPLGRILVDQGLLAEATLRRLLELQETRVLLRQATALAADTGYAALVAAAVANGATELVVSEGRPPRIRVATEWRELAAEPMRGPEVWDFVRSALGNEVLEELAEHRFVERGIRGPDGPRGTATAFRQFDGVAVRLLFAPAQVPEATAAGVPARVLELASAGSGLVLLGAERGLDRGGALAVLLAAAAAGDPQRHVVVLDDGPLPTAAGSASLRRRRYGVTPAARTAALQAALREDPDVLAIADVGDPATFELALRAATGGRLVLACIDGANVTAVLHRVLNFYAVHDLPRLRTTLAAALRAVLVRHPLPDTARTGVVVASELLLVDEPVRDVLRGGELGELGVLLRLDDGRHGHTLDRSLLDLMTDGRVRVEDVFARAEEKAWLLERTRTLPTPR